MSNSLSYTGRDATDIKRALIDLVPQLTDSWKDFNESDLGVTIIELIAAAQDMQNFYFDTQTFETYLDTAVQDKNIRSILRAMNYRIPFRGAAKGTVRVSTLGKVTFEEDVKFPMYTEFWKSGDRSILYVSTDENILKSGDAYVDIDVMQGKVITEEFSISSLSSSLTPSGNVSRRIYLKGTDKVADNSVKLTHGSDIWEECDDALLKYEGGKYYSVHKDAFDRVYVLMSVDFVNQLSDDTTIPLTITYLETEGLDGVLDAGEIDNYSLDSSYEFEVTNLSKTYGAYEVPNLQSLKILARRQALCMDRYITLGDYENAVATEPYIMKYVVADWKTQDLIDIPYVVGIWAVDYTGDNLGDKDVETLKSKLYKKGVTDVEVRYFSTEFVDIDIKVQISLKSIVSGVNSEKVVNAVKEELNSIFSLENLKYEQYFSINLIQSKVYSVSEYIRDVYIESPVKDIKLSEVQFPRINSISVSVISSD